MYKQMVAVFAALFSVMASVPASAQQPAVSARCAILVEASTGTVLFEKNADEERPMASTTKLMTALLTAEWNDPETEVIVPDAACGVEGSSLGLKAGDYLTLRDLLAGMLLASGNDAATAAALAVDETVEAFAERMNTRAAELGMTHTRFVTPSGLDAAGHHSTARDMATLGIAVMREPLLREIAGQKTATLKIGNPKTARTVKNHNRLLWSVDGAIGLKTGFTKAAGRCLVSAAERNGITLVCVTLNAPDDWNDHAELFAYGFSEVARVDLPVPILPTLPVGGGDKTEVRLAARSPSVVLPIAEQTRVSAKLVLPPFLLAPVKAGARVGTLHYYCGNTLIAKADVTVSEAAESRPILTPWRHYAAHLTDLVQTILT